MDALTPGLQLKLHTGLLLAVNLCFSVPALSRKLTAPSYNPSASSMPSAVHAMHTTLLLTCRPQQYGKDSAVGLVC
jgi:hypothetical protein